MANRYFEQFHFSLIKYPVKLVGSAAIGASGATSALTGNGILSLTRVAAGTYKLILEDDYNRFLHLKVLLRSPVTGSAVTAGSFVSGTVYQIVTLGTTNYSAVGLDAGTTAAVGQVFVATGAGSGTGTVKALGNSGIATVELIGNPLPATTTNGSGSILYFQTLDATLAAADPASGSTLYLEVLMRNSSVKGKGE